ASSLRRLRDAALTKTAGMPGQVSRRSSAMSPPSPSGSMTSTTSRCGSATAISSPRSTMRAQLTTLNPSARRMSASRPAKNAPPPVGCCEGARSKTRHIIMARSMWRGAIQFGLVTIPVKLYLATEQGGIGFNMLHKTCLNRIQMKIWCPYHEEVIPRSETVRGYEWSKDKYVVVTDEDRESVPLKTVRPLEIEKFVDEEQAEETASRFVKQAYY